MMVPAMAIEATLSPRGKAEAFLSKISTPVQIVTDPKTKVAPPKKIVLITPREYWEDAKTRWAIHTLHWSEFIEDCKWIINEAKPYIQKAIDKIKPYIDKAITWVKDIFDADKKKST